jgi:hypothetical protein
MREYDDERYLQWCHEFQALVAEFLDTEGNTDKSLRAEFDNAIENAGE